MQLKETTPEQRRSYYNDLRELLNPGFLAHTVEVNGSTLVLRSLNPGDLFLLQHRVGISSRQKKWKNWTLAMGIWMVDGQILLGDHSATYRIYEMCEALPKTVRDDLFSIFTGLMTRMRDSMNKAEAFLYEEETRYLWKSEGPRLFDANAIPGIPKMGINSMQKLWAYYNTYEDMREDRDYWWAVAKFVVSAHAPKGVKRLNQSDEQSKNEEKKRRQRAQDFMYYEATGHKLDPRTKSLVGPISSLRSADTKEELEEEMRNWVAGNRDFHDDVVVTTKANIRRKHDHDDVEKIRRIREIQDAMAEDEVDEPSLMPLMGAAREQAMQRLKHKQPAKVFADDTHNSAYDKYIKDDAEVGALAVQGERLLVRNPGQIPHEDILEAMKNPDTKEPPPKRSLDEQVKARGKPTLGPQGDE